MKTPEEYLLLKEKYERMEGALRQIYYDLFINDSELHQTDVLLSTEALLTAVKELSVSLEIEDENLDLEKTKLPNLEELFEDDPITELVKAKVAVLQAGDNDTEASQKLEEAAKAAAEHQNGPQPAKSLTFDEFVDNAVAEMDLPGESDYADRFAAELKSAVTYIEENNIRAGAQFLVTTNEGNKMGSVVVTDESITVRLQHKEWTYSLLAQPEAEEAPVEGECTGDPSTCYCGKEKEMTLLEEIRMVTEIMDTVYFEAVERAEKYLLGLDKLEKDDYELIRFYLKNLPSNSDYDIDALTDEGLLLAWNRIVYLKKQ